VRVTGRVICRGLSRGWSSNELALITPPCSAPFVASRPRVHTGTRWNSLFGTSFVSNAVRPCASLTGVFPLTSRKRAPAAWPFYLPHTRKTYIVEHRRTAHQTKGLAEFCIAAGCTSTRAKDRHSRRRRFSLQACEKLKLVGCSRKLASSNRCCCCAPRNCRRALTGSRS
jgi:hypothetical protein